MNTKSKNEEQNILEDNNRGDDNDTDEDLELKEEIRERWKYNFQKYIKMNINMREYNVNLKPTPEEKYIRIVDEIVNEELNNIEEEYEIDMWIINVIYYTTAVTVLEKEGRQREIKRVVKNKEKPGWQIRMESRIEAIRRKISYAYVLKNCIEKNDYTKRQKYIKRRFEKQYGKVTKNNLNKVLTDLKHDLKVDSEKLRRKKTIQERKYINRMFKVAPKKVYRGMRDGSQQKVKNMPEQTEVESFWKSIWNVPTQHNTEAPWLEDLKQEYCKNVKARDYEITDEVLDKILSKLANDKPGRDLVPGLWIKRLSSMKEHFKRNLINSFNLDKEIPQWLVLSKTLLLPKNEDTNKANNYRPIVLQNSMHKVFTAIITEFIMYHCTVNNIVTEEQAAGKLGSWGCAD